MCLPSGQWCEKAVETAAFIATSDVAAPAAAKTLRFWRLYWGVMGMVENQQVTDAMIAFGGKARRKGITQLAPGDGAPVGPCVPSGDG